ncbi:prolipoprotein diacylglyceryl transferase [Sphingobacterium hungaricum]|uniref:Diacylglyceryl transferase n=1 Tax=Sphingobacterium hungaricum TaxID=2082723 RepID=A0A928V2B2_9SPHI|nr:prolipoprotein diacylglyceryl transferase family protein [Sphingobacterium hungaricum]MBE8715329.1 diacylglyceryl transferase [Sphingobacterium hungaricum]
MFPTISSLINYLFSTNFNWPFPTFGFFVALAFVLSYFTFKSEFERKEKLGDIKAFPSENKFAKNYFWIYLMVYAVSGFVVGYKLVGVVGAYKLFISDPYGFMFSSAGSWLGGIIFLLLAMLAFYFEYKKSQNISDGQVSVLVSPKELMPTLVLWAAVTGFIGAKLFNVFEDYELHKSHSLIDIFHFSGLTFWGGLIFGAASYLYIGIRNGIPWKHLADIGSLGMLVAYAVGRMGCHFSGDGDWGIVNRTVKPLNWLQDWMWSSTFPHNVINQGKYIDGCTGAYCHELIDPVYPTSLYEFSSILLVFFVLYAIRNKVKTAGLMFTIYLFVIGIERFLIEFLRVNYKYDALGYSLSEAQLISLLIVVFAVFMLGHLIYQRQSKTRLTKITM